jgi:hypothetical protein
VCRDQGALVTSMETIEMIATWLVTILTVAEGRALRALFCACRNYHTQHTERGRFTRSGGELRFSRSRLATLQRAYGPFGIYLTSRIRAWWLLLEPNLDIYTGWRTRKSFIFLLSIEPGYNAQLWRHIFRLLKYGCCCVDSCHLA